MDAHLRSHEPTTPDNILGTTTAPQRSEHREACTICLEPVSERAVAVPCNHLTFDKKCLVEWLREQRKCPLCKATVTEVQYDFRGPEDWKSYIVPRSAADEESEDPRPTRQQQQQQRRRRRPRSRPLETCAPAPDPALEGRRNVYRHGLYSRRVGANAISGYRNVTAGDVARSAELQTKVKVFLRRELQAFTFLDDDDDDDGAQGPRGRSRDFLVEYVAAIARTKDLKGAGGEAEDMLCEFLGRENARLLLHELEAWLRSPYLRLAEWDECVQYEGQDMR